MHESVLHLSELVKLRYSFWLYEGTFPELILLNAGNDPKRYYMRKHNISEEEYDDKVRHMEPLPGFFLEGKDACLLAVSILSQLELPTEEADEVYTDNALFTVDEFYSILNNLISKLWQIKF